MRTTLDPRLTLDDGDTISSFEFSDSFLGAKILRKGAYVSVPITLIRIALFFFSVFDIIRQETLGKSFLVLCTAFNFWFEIIDSSIDGHSSGMQW